MPFEIDFWHWWIFAVVLVIIEILVPSFFALWMAIAAFMTGLALLLMPSPFAFSLSARTALSATRAATLAPASWESVMSMSNVNVLKLFKALLALLKTDALALLMVHVPSARLRPSVLT